MIRVAGPALVLLLVGASLAWLASGAPPSGFYADDAVYLLTAERLAGNDDAVAVLMAGHSHLPPLYSMALAASDASGDRPLPGHLLDAVLLATALAFAYALHARRQPPLLALLGVVVVAVLPGTLLHLTTLWSESLYMALSFACLVLAARREPTRGAWLALGVLAGLALLTRGIAVALVAALLWQCLGRAREATPALLAGLLMPLAAWWLFGWERNPESGYVTIFANAFQGPGVAEFLRVPSANLVALWQGWRDNLDVVGHPASGHAAAALLALAAAGLGARLRHGETDAVYVTGYLAILLPWPASADHFDRFLLPVTPLALAYALDSGLRIGTIVGRRLESLAGMLGTLVLTLPLAIALPSLALIATRLADPLPAELAAYQHSPWWLRNPERSAALADVRLRAGTIRAAAELRRLVPEDACVYARHVQLLMLHARRVAVLPPPRGASEWRHCDYAFAPASLDNLVLVDGIPPGSKIIHRATLPGDGARYAGLLFKLPPSRVHDSTDDAD